jgi:arabinofuranan 3-O-arabinosyltransferase
VDSTSRSIVRLGARNLADADVATAWIAGDKPVIHLKWQGKRSIDEIVFAAAGGLSSRPEQVLIDSPDGAATAYVDENGQARFPAIVTDRLDITVSKVAPLTVYNPVAGAPLQLPVGLSEVYVPALKDLGVKRPESSTAFSVPCGQGPSLTIDGTTYATKVSGVRRDLTERRPVRIRLCDWDQTQNGKIALAAGQHRVDADDADGWAISDVTISQGQAPQTVDAAGRRASVVAWSGDSRKVAVSAGSPERRHICKCMRPPTTAGKPP